MANTQTAVPLFVANAILTAAQQNISAGTGVPVFATTVTRDAAFGGSNKALAEGQLCYLEDSNIVQYYTGAAWATVGPTASKVAQVLSTTLATTFSSSTLNAFTDITGLSVSITPTLNTSKILVSAYLLGTGYVSGSAGRAVQLVRGSTAIAVGTAEGSRQAASGVLSQTDTGVQALYYFSTLDSPATTSATTYKVQFWNDTGTFTVNRSSADGNSTNIFRTASTITVMEVLA